MSGRHGMVRVRRVAAGLTQEQLAELSGLSVRAISDIERGTTARPRRSSIALLEAALNRSGEDGDTPSSDEAPSGGRGLRSSLPQQLPHAVAGFVGRARELDALTGLLFRSGTDCGAVVISALAGTAGVGKTALAVHWAHQVAERFHDGQLYVNLRGYDPDRPMTAADALTGFLRALGVPGQDIPAEEADRAARYRSLLAGRRMLVVLDNASEVEQVRPLLPGSPACAVVVTSRDSLAGLVARDGAERLDLDLLPPEDAVGLLRVLIGARVDADPAAAATLASQCCRLPLALRVAAELAAARPAAPLAELAAELADQQRRLDLLEAAGDRRTTVRAVFSWSYRHLHDDAAHAFRLLGLHPGADFDPYAAAALIGTTLEQARRVLDQLARAHLIQPAARNRYGLHDLLRAYARELATAQDSHEEQQAALTRMFDHYLYTAAMAMDTLYRAEPHRRPRIARPASPALPLTDPVVARGWLDAERGTLVAVISHTAELGWPGHATRLAATLYRYLDGNGYNSEALIINSHALTAARQAGDRAAEATALNGLGAVHWRLGRYQQATSRLQGALALLLETGDRTGQAVTLGNLGSLYALQGRYGRAASFLEQALHMFRETGDRIGETRALGNLGTVEERRGRYEQAGRHHQDSLDLARRMGDRRGESYGLMNLGQMGLLQGRYQDAIGQLRRALVLFGEVGDRNGEAEALNGLGEALLADGQPGDARAQHAAALGLASQIGDKHQQARAHNGLACAYQVTLDPRQARRHWQQALAIYTELGVPEADQVRSRLAGAGNDSHREREDSRPQ